MNTLFIFLFFICLASFIKYVVSKHVEILLVIILLIANLIIGSIVVFIDYKCQTSCKEVWSGEIVSVNHKEEWDEWHEPWDEEITETDSKGNVHTKIKHHPGYWEHHDAENYIKTTDDGTFYVRQAPDGRIFTDSFVNSDKELEEFYPIGRPTASIHTYENKVQASYSIYKHTDINLDTYPNLPEYPKNVENYCITRYIGETIEDKEDIINQVNKLNSYLNNTNNPNNIDNVKSYKQVNVIFVNLGNVTQDYGIALQDLWQNGNKNDFVVTFGTDDNNKIIWSYPFSWSESEDCKYEVKNIMTKEDLSLSEKIDLVGKSIEDKYERKQFADFSYLQIELSKISKVILGILTIISIISIFIIDTESIERRY
jgi:hypothetical protein